MPRQNSSEGRIIKNDHGNIALNHKVYHLRWLNGQQFTNHIYLKILGVICFSQKLFPVLSKEKNSLYFSLEYILYLKTKLDQKKEEKKALLHKEVHIV